MRRLKYYIIRELDNKEIDRIPISQYAYLVAKEANKHSKDIQNWANGKKNGN